jgi:hypothetical protein
MRLVREMKPQLKARGCDKVLPGQSYRTLQAVVMDLYEYGEMVEM